MRRQGGEDALRKALGAVRAVFEHRKRARLREQAEAAGREERRLLAPRDHKEIKVAALKAVLDERREEGAECILPAQFLADRKAL